MERKIVVPREMLGSALEGCLHLPIELPDGIGAAVVACALEAGLRWLSENPILPTHDQIRTYFEDMIGLPLKPSAIPFIVARWQSAMFVAPDDPSENDICEIGAILRDRGFRVSNFQIGEILMAERDNMGTEIPVRRSTFIHTTEVADFASDGPCIEFEIGTGQDVPESEPEVPDEIKDLLEWDCNWGSNYLKGYIIEAYRRGQKAGKQ